MKKGWLLWALVLWTGGAAAAPPAGDLFYRIGRSIDVFGRVYREVATGYVDEVDPDRFMEAGIAGMLGTLDPYTVYIDREDGDEVELITDGKYGGIGVTIGLRDGAIQVISVMEGYSAQRQGILAGDRIIDVDGVSVIDRKPDDVRSLTRGTPGTEVRVTVERDGERLTFVLLRQEIQIRNVTYAGFIADGIAYVRLERFSRTAGDEMRTALRDLKARGEIRGMILDLRGNPGGLLDAAVEVAGKFVPRGSLVVSTRGRNPGTRKQYLSTEEPLLPAARLVVLTDNTSASASEIVAGAVQDLDRGLVVGERTFGKGLVQTILPMPDGAQLKITTARYYTPSGRSIQEIDYLRRNKDGVFAPYADSLKKEFRTAAGRIVFEHGGITPDSVVPEAETGVLVRTLLRKSLFFRFAARAGAAAGASVTDSVLAQFRVFLEEQKFDFEDEAVMKTKELRASAEKLGYGAGVLDGLGRLEAGLAAEKGRSFDRARERIRRELAMELGARARGEAGRIEASWTGDPVVETALALLRAPEVYTARLKP